MFCFYIPIVFRHMRFKVPGGRKRNAHLLITVVVVIFVRMRCVFFITNFSVVFLKNATIPPNIQT